MRIFLLMILYLSGLLDYTLFPKISSFEHLNLLLLNFIYIGVYFSKLLLPSIFLIGVSKDILSSFPLGTYTLIFIVVGFFIQTLLKFVSKDNMLSKILLVSLGIIIFYTVPILWSKNFDFYSILKRIVINSIFFIFWAKILNWIIKWVEVG